MNLYRNVRLNFQRFEISKNPLKRVKIAKIIKIPPLPLLTQDLLFKQHIALRANEMIVIVSPGGLACADERGDAGGAFVSDESAHVAAHGVSETVMAGFCAYV